ncbi:HAD-like domain-containing protein [Sphaerosporella brunnea]|uniref:4-nitrophenylphosphatase n=1 Tax=Sphaerosporella brunnea TaxID=1250544 RepID=A0A5J5ER38_9PEZI|nr:HAD-like domain-containing protein [Sphaerosporella brunnea]
MPSSKKLTGKPDEIAAFLDRFDVFLFDCDGVLWRGDKLLPKVVETLEMLRSKGKQVVFVTNNSTKSRRAYVSKLNSLGIPASADEIFGSAYSAAIYISRVLSLPKDKKVYVIGEAGIEEELASEGVSFFGGTDPAERAEISEADYEAIGPNASVGVVLVGLDRGINYRKLARAHGYLQHPETRFLATNIDSTFPTHGGLFPGAGSMSAPLTYMTGREPLSLGKPSQAMMQAIEGRFKFDKKRTCMVGDRINTDIKFGIEGGLGGTLGVLTGVSKEEEFLNGEVVPEAYVDKLADLLG